MKIDKVERLMTAIDTTKIYINTLSDSSLKDKLLDDVQKISIVVSQTIKDFERMELQIADAFIEAVEFEMNKLKAHELT